MTTPPYRIGRENRGKPDVLKKRDLPSLAEFIKSKDCKRITLMLGAGVSTSAGIPDFRSPGTGLYHNLARLNLPHAEAVFEINYFRSNPVPFYTLAHELYPGKFRPTVTHSFIRLLAEKGLLHACFTQNIDTLERQAGVPDDKVIEAHGSFASNHCIDCKAPYDNDKMKDHVLEKKIPKCERCGGYVKPDIVFFGESLPPRFIASIDKIRSADLLLVIGTSLTVHPFATLAELTDVPRVLINIDQVGTFGRLPDDLSLLGKCDEVVRELAKELGWEEDLNRLWAETDLEKKKPGEKERKKGKLWTPPTFDEIDAELEAESRASEPSTLEEDVSEVLEEIEESLRKLAVDDEDQLKKEKEEKPDPGTVTSGSDDSEKATKPTKSADKSSAELEKKSDQPKKLESSVASGQSDKPQQP